MPDFFTGTPAQAVDTRSGEQITQERGRLDTSAALRSEYDRAVADPSFALMPPDQARHAEQELTSNVLGRVGAAGGAGSTYGRSLAAKALVDFRIGQMAQQQAARVNMRNALIASQGGQGQPLGQVAPQAGVGQQMGERVAGAVGNRTGSAMADSIYGSAKSAEQGGSNGGMNVQGGQGERRPNEDAYTRGT